MPNTEASMQSECEHLKTFSHLCQKFVAKPHGLLVPVSTCVATITPPAYQPRSLRGAFSPGVATGRDI